MIKYIWTSLLNEHHIDDSILQCGAFANDICKYTEQIANIINANKKMIAERKYKFNPTSVNSGGGHKIQIVAIRMTTNGISTTRAGQEQYEIFYLRQRGKKMSRIMYDYRTTDGELFSVVVPTLEECCQKRYEWSFSGMTGSSLFEVGATLPLFTLASIFVASRLDGVPFISFAILLKKFIPIQVHLL